MAFTEEIYQRFLAESQNDPLQPVWHAAVQHWLSAAALLQQVDHKSFPGVTLDSSVHFCTEGVVTPQSLRVPNYLARIATVIQTNYQEPDTNAALPGSYAVA